MLRLLLILAFIFQISSALAQGTENYRAAFVIGNKNYDHLRSLKNTANDAVDIADVLATYRFDTQLFIDQDIDTFVDDFSIFLTAMEDAKSSGKSTDAIFYYAGHGIESSGQNFLLPTDFSSSNLSSFKIERQAISLSEVLSQLSRVADRTIVILDACRDDPFSDQQAAARSVARARFASPPSLATGTIVFYCAGLNQTAKDFLPTDDPLERGNGVCTRFIIETLRDSPGSFEDAANRIQELVYNATLAHFTPAQTPAIYDQLVGSYRMDGQTDVKLAALIESDITTQIASQDASISSDFELFSSDLRGGFASNPTSQISQPLLGSSLSIFFRPDRLMDAQEISSQLSQLGANVSVIGTDLAEVTEFPAGTNRVVSLTEMTRTEEQILSRVNEVLEQRSFTDSQQSTVNTRLNALRSGPIQLQLF